VQGLAGLLPTAAWHALVRAGRPRNWSRDEQLLRQGDDGAYVLLLTSGRVKITRFEQDGRQLLLAIRGPGEALGEISALDGSTRTATVTALGACVTYVLPAAQFQRVVRDFEAVDVVLRHILARLREGEEIRADLAHLSAGQRLARILLRLSTAAGHDRTGQASAQFSLDLGLSQEELGLAAGLSRSAVAAELGRLREQGLVSTGRRRLVLLDVDRLRRSAEEGSAGTPRGR
jgi:CRP/FNR family transcriptional regulator, cyclic AMP receptor protein